MAKPKLKNGYTMIANETLEALSRVNLSPYETRVLWAIIRKTYGYRRKTDRIPLSQIVKATGMSKPNICHTLKKLLRRSIIVRLDNKHIGFEEDYEKWASKLSKQTTEEKLSKQTMPLFKQTMTSKLDYCSNEHPQKIIKETISKERRTKKISSPDPRVKKILAEISEKLGHQIPFYPKEAVAVKRALDMNFSPEQFIACWEKLKIFKFWEGKWLPLAKVTENLGEFVAGRLRDGIFKDDSLRTKPLSDHARQVREAIQSGED